MKEILQTPFAFKNHRITSVDMKVPDEVTDLGVEFNPSGIYNATSGIFTLTLEFNVTSRKNGNNFLEITANAEFQFKENISGEEIPDFFYSNCIAIFYPFLRAFVTTITSVANIRPLILPTLNLQSLDKPLKENTKFEN